MRRERVSSPHREHRNVDDEQYMREDITYKLYDNAQMRRIVMGRVFPHHDVQGYHETVVPVEGFLESSHIGSCVSRLSMHPNRTKKRYPNEILNFKVVGAQATEPSSASW